MSDRSEMEAARQIGLAKRHESRLQRATYTAAEVKVLTEAASKVAYALGRKDAGEEAALKADGDCRLCLGLGGIALHEKWSAARGKPLWTAHVIPNDDPHPTYPCPLCAASQAAGATSDATSGVPGHREVSEAVRSPQEPGEGT